jgi:hypothetical protein
MTPARNIDVSFTWLREGTDRPRKTVVKTMAPNGLRAIEIALRAIALDKSIPANATIKRVRL